MNAAELFVRCLENEGVEMIFGLPGEENIAVMDVLLDSSIRFITVRHEAGAAKVIRRTRPIRRERTTHSWRSWANFSLRSR